MTMLFQILLSLAFAAAPKNAAEIKKLDRATAFLRGKDAYQMTVEKVVVYELLDKTVTSAGEISIASGKFRWDTNSPEKSTALYDGKILWAIQYPDPKLGGPVQAAKSKIDGKAKDQLLIKILTDKSKFSSKFKVSELTKEDGVLVFQLEPTKEDPTIRKFSVRVKSKAESLSEIAYTDEVGNLTTVKILEKKKLKKPDPNLFKANLPADAQVNEL